MIPRILHVYHAPAVQVMCLRVRFSDHTYEATVDLSQSPWALSGLRAWCAGYHGTVCRELNPQGPRGRQLQEALRAYIDFNDYTRRDDEQTN